MRIAEQPSTSSGVDEGGGKLLSKTSNSVEGASREPRKKMFFKKKVQIRLRSCLLGFVFPQRPPVPPTLTLRDQIASSSTFLDLRLSFLSVLGECVGVEPSSRVRTADFFFMTAPSFCNERKSEGVPLALDAESTRLRLVVIGEEVFDEVDDVTV